MILLDLAVNLALLVALAATFQVMRSRWHLRRLSGQFLHGLLFGAVGVLDMMTPVHFLPGIIFDGRSIILGVAGLFGGPMVALIATVACGAYRLWLGGAGTLMGLGVILESAALGVAFHYWRRRSTRPTGWAQLWVFGLLVHGVMLAMVMLLPGGSRQAVWHQFGPAIMGVYPVATVLICLLFLDYERQRQSRTALEESEARFRSLFEQATDGMLLTDPVTQRLLLANRGIERMLGYSGDELLRLTVADLHPAADLPTVLGRFEELSRGERSSACETPVRRKDGTVLYADIHLALVRLQQRECVLGVFRDITERKRAAEALQEHTAFLNMLLEAIPAPVFYKDAEGRYLGVNQAFETFYGKRRVELVGRSVFDIAPRELAEVYHAKDLELLRNPGVQVYGAKLKDAQGVLHDVAFHKTTLQDAGGRVSGLLGVILDLTEHKRAEERLRQQAALLDAANDAICVLAPDHTVTYWNVGAERLYGWSQAEALGRKLTELGNWDAPAFAAAHATLLEQGYWSGELKLTSMEGRELVIFCRWTLLRDHQGRSEVLAINTDITEQKQLEANFLRAQRMEGIGSLASGVAHDLNNILAPILMIGPLLRMTVNDPESRELIDMMESCAQRGADIIQQLLTFARGKPGVRAPLPVQHLLKEIHKLISETFPRNLQLRLHLARNLRTIQGDATQVHQALVNLCVNARDAMPAGGTLTLGAANAVLDEALAARTPDGKPGDYVCLSVADTGTGIAPENLDRIFDPFFTTKELGQGTGLGLATVLGIVRGHGGFVRVKSQVGQGTTFELGFPASPEVKTPAPAGLEPPPRPGQGELILVVDDEPSVREVVRHSLEKHGYRVVVAREGNEALALFAARRAEIKAVVTDLMMPGWDGPKLVQALRQLEARLPILGMTGLADQAGGNGPADPGLPTLLIKPFTGAKLLGALRETLAQTD